MKTLSSQELRKLWIDFFIAKDHYLIKSLSLIPVNDNSLLWINSGIATLKEFFEAKSTPPSKRIVNYQKSIRTNDIEIIGRTSRHHTFFEMLGNFSIGDYFSKEAIIYAWEFLTSKQWLDIDPEKLYITVLDEDQQTYDEWISVGIKPNHLLKLTKKTNFWDVGKGPCGPNTEIFYDRGNQYDIRGVELLENDLENDRFVEIWNIVLSKFNNNGKDVYTELPQKNIDTGAGFERLVCISQNKPSNFETDLFWPLIEVLQTYTAKQYQENYYSINDLDSKQQEINYWFKSIVDFVRALTFAIADGAKPANIGRGYTLRKILRKAILNLRYLEIKEPILSKISEKVIEIMSDVFPNLVTSKTIIISILNEEELLFSKTLATGLEYLEKNYQKNLIATNILSSEFVFKLFETIGLPLEIIEENLQNQNLSYDKKTFNLLLENFKNLSKQSSKMGTAMTEQENFFNNISSTIFIGYDLLTSNQKLLAKEVKDDKLYLAFDKTPFYVESGGQVSDQGMINNLELLNVLKNPNNTIIHVLDIKHENLFIVGNEYLLSVNAELRQAVSRNHSGIHLLFSALETILKIDLPQRGSKVTAKNFRFDFSYHQKLSYEELDQAQALANKWINDKIAINIFETTFAKAQTYGAKFLDTGKYGNLVRVVEFKNVCIDLCGGTHIKNSQEIEQLKITSFEYKGSGVYRINAISTINEIELYEKNALEEKTKLLNQKYLQIIEKQLQQVEDLNKLNFYPSEQKFTKELTFWNEALNLVKQNQTPNHLINKSIEELQIEFQIAFKNDFSKACEIFLNSEQTQFTFSNLSKSGFALITDLILHKRLKNSFSLINKTSSEEASLALILNDEHLFDLKSKKEFLKEINLKGGGSRNFYNFKGSIDSINKLITKIWSEF